MQRQAAEVTPPVKRHYQVGDRKLFLHRSGKGSPAVVFLPGAGSSGMDGFVVQRRAAELTTSVLYDRAGTGWSDRAELPRTSTQVTDELRELLPVAGVSAPYLLVGHSLGGLYARHYARPFPRRGGGPGPGGARTRGLRLLHAPEAERAVPGMGPRRGVARGVARRDRPVLPRPVRPGDGRLATGDSRAANRRSRQPRNG
ncbi:alpha/beta fold hydrolase [Streptosporangium amethystogenes]